MFVSFVCERGAGACVCVCVCLCLHAGGNLTTHLVHPNTQNVPKPILEFTAFTAKNYDYVTIHKHEFLCVGQCVCVCMFVWLRLMVLVRMWVAVQTKRSHALVVNSRSSRRVLSLSKQRVRVPSIALLLSLSAPLIVRALSRCVRPPGVA